MRTLPAFKLVPEPLSDEAREAMKPLPYVEPEIGTRHRLGGEPDFIQQEKVPVCPQCQQPMTFYAQLDAVGQDSEYDIADAGLIYVFLCFDDFEAKAVVHSG